MRIENLTKEEKAQILNDLLKDALTTAPESKAEILAEIEKMTTSSVSLDRDIEEWANRNPYFLSM